MNYRMKLWSKASETECAILWGLYRRMKGFLTRCLFKFLVLDAESSNMKSILGKLALSNDRLVEELYGC
jgi:hypothetical protein